MAFVEHDGWAGVVGESQGLHDVLNLLRRWRRDGGDGDGGGEVVGEGTPEEIADEPRSHTGRYLKEMLSPKRVAAE